MILLLLLAELIYGDFLSIMESERSSFHYILQSAILDTFPTYLKLISSFLVDQCDFLKAVLVPCEMDNAETLAGYCGQMLLQHH